MIDEVLKTVKRFRPETMTQAEREDFCSWWRGLDSAVQSMIRQERPADAMVADLATYGRAAAYELTCTAYQGYIERGRGIVELTCKVAGLENVIAAYDLEMKRRMDIGCRNHARELTIHPNTQEPRKRL